LDELDAGALEVAVELLDVALVNVDLRDRGSDLAEGQHSDLLALAQQILYLFKFLKLSYKHSASSCSVLSFRSRGPCSSEPALGSSGADRLGMSRGWEMFGSAVRVCRVCMFRRHQAQLREMALYVLY